MKKYFLLLVFIGMELFAGNGSGKLLIIGGGKRPVEIMQKFIDLAGGNESNILIIPIASGDPIGTAEYQKEEILKFGAKKVDFIICTNEEANTDSVLKILDNVTGIFISGGDQNRITKILLDTRFLKKMKQFYKNGGVIAGTSAGAAVMSKVMITGDELNNPDSSRSFIEIKKENIKTTEGFGFVTSAIIDQHFIIRKRHNRLISVVLENPNLIGIGIDESTAVLVTDGNKFEVIGESQVILYDARKVKEINNGVKGKMSANGISMSILYSGDKFRIEESRN